MAVKILVDSTTDLSHEIKDEIAVIPLTIRFGDKEFIHGIELKNEDFYKMLIESDVLPTTSQPTPQAFEKIFSDLTENGDTVVAITLSSKLSGTYQSACIAAQGFKGKVFVVDSLNVAIGAGVLAEFALRLSKEGRSAEAIVNELLEKRQSVHLIAMVDTLEYLKKGGRLSAVAAIAGGLLSIKPVIAIRDGEIAVLGKARGSKQGTNLLVKEIELAGGVDFGMPLLLGYTGLSDLILKKYIEDSSYLWEEHLDSLRSTLVGSVVGTHAGPGAVAVAFFKASS